MTLVSPLAAHDLAISRDTPPAEKLAQTLELMSVGIRLRRAVLEQARPEATEVEISEALEVWLSADG